MLSSSAAAAAQIEGPDQHIDVRVSVDWDRDGHGPAGSLDDVSELVDELTVDRSLADELPDEARLIDGYTAAQLTASLVRVHENPPPGLDADQIEDWYDARWRDAAWYFSRLNSRSPLAGKERLSRPVTAHIGVRLPNGSTEWFRRFTGLSRSLPVSASDGSADLTALDKRELLRAPVQLPMIMADYRDNRRLPGLRASWIVNHVLRGIGLYQTPPTRSGAVLAASLQGSAYPELGTLYSADLNIAGTRYPVRFAQGLFGACMDHAGPGESGNATWLLRDGHTAPITVNDGDSFLFECWANLRATGGFVMYLGVVTGLPDGYIYYHPNGQLDFYLDRDGDDDTDWVFRAGVTPGWHYIGWQITFTSAGMNVRICVDNVPSAVVPIASASVTDHAGFHYLAVYNDHQVEAVQLTNEGTSAAFNGTWTPQGVSIDVSLNELDAILPTTATTEGWTLLKQVAAAELAIVGWDETDTFVYRTRARYATPGLQGPVRVLTTDQSILELAYDDALDAVRNQVTVPVQPVTVGGTRPVWVAPQVLALTARSSITIRCEFTNPVLDLADDYYIFGEGHDDQTWFRACTDASGASGETFRFAVRLSDLTATGVTLTLTSKHELTIFFVALNGGPGISLAGRPVTASGSGQSVTARDENSISEYGLQPLSLPASPWMQQSAPASAVANGLVAQLARSRPVLTGVTWIGDPRLQAGDRVLLQDRDGIGLNAEYWIVSLKDQVRPGSYVQAVTLREAWSIAEWDGVGAWGDDRYGWGL